MKKVIMIIALIMSGSLLFNVSANAGTLMLGAKGWYAWWDSAIGEFFVSQTNGLFEDYLTSPPPAPNASSADINSDIEPGRGILGGPLVSYQTDDKQWSFSCAFMYFGKFKQEADTVAYVDGSPFDAKYEIDLNRKEIDVAVIRILTPNIKVFFGYKHQMIEQDIDLYVDVNGGMFFRCYEIDAVVKAPTAGFGFSFPFSDTTFLGGQLGLLYVMPTIKYKNYITNNLFPTQPVEDREYNFDNTIGVNAEVNLTIFASQEVVLQLGYRYQMMKFKKSFGEESSGESFSESDVFHGFVFSAVYLMNM